MRHPLSLFGIVVGVALTAAPAFAQIVDKTAGDWLIRGRAIVVTPDESSTISAIGGDVNVDTAYMPELDISYFFTDNVAAELILSTTNHSAVAEGTSLGDVDVGDVWLLPPTLTAQYHFSPKGAISPYVGAGINMTLFYDSDAPGTVVTDTQFSNSVGPALQAGIDFAFADDWIFNVDVKKIWIDTTVSINGAAIEADLNINPWVVGVGLGKRF